MIQSSDIERRLDAQERQIAELRALVVRDHEMSPFRIVEIHEKIREMTCELFQSEVTIRHQVDPEIDDEYYIVRATACGTSAEIARRLEEWHALARKIAHQLASQYRLSIDVK